jgi:biotin carboxylase
VLGAGEGQLPIYLEARRRGLHVIAVDRDREALALPYADEHLPVSVRDPDAIVAALAGRAPTAVLAGAGEQATWSWYELSERLGTPYRYPRSAAVASTDKGAFHATAEKASVNTYRWRHSTDLDSLAAQAAEVGFPLVAKPVDGAGKKGLALVETPAQLAAALEYAARHSAAGGVVIEQFLRGRDLTIDVFMREGRAAFTAVHEKIVEPGWSFRIRGHVTPAPLAAETHRRLADTAEMLCQEIGLTDGPADFDVFLGDGGEVQVVEVNARLPGEAVPPLMQAVYGIDIVAALVALALGDPVDVQSRSAGAGLVHTLASPLRTTGTLREVRGLAAVREMPGVARCELYLAPGATVPPFPALGNEVGYLVVTGDDLAAAEATLAAAMDRLELRITPQPADGRPTDGA